jgi:hypothetical protein
VGIRLSIGDLLGLDSSQILVFASPRSSFRQEEQIAKAAAICCGGDIVLPLQSKTASRLAL